MRRRRGCSFFPEPPPPYFTLLSLLLQITRKDINDNKQINNRTRRDYELARWQLFRWQLDQQVRSLRRPALKRLIAHLLIAQGYTKVRLLQRKWGRSGDIEASGQTGLTHTSLIVQVKKQASPVHRHVLDELRSTVLRAGAQQGLLITTSTFSRVARREVQRSHLAPLTLVDGEQLLDLLITHQVGAIPVGATRQVEVPREQMGKQRAGDNETTPNKTLENEAFWRVDTEFFSSLTTPRRPMPGAPMPSCPMPCCPMPSVPISSGSLPKQLMQSPSTPDQCALAHAAASPMAASLSHQGELLNLDQKLHQNENPFFTRGGAMTWRTHMLSGLAALWLVQLLPGGVNITNIGPLAAGAAFGALLPDLDAAESKIKHLRLNIRPLGSVKLFAPLATALYRGLGHRGLLHSFAGAGVFVLLTLVLAFWWGWQLSVALVLGYAAHLAGDACTKSGIPLLYPAQRRYHLLPHGWRLTTGSQAEDVILALLLAAVALLLLRVLISLLGDSFIGGSLASSGFAGISLASDSFVQTRSVHVGSVVTLPSVHIGRGW